MTDTKATPTDRLLAGLDAMGAAYNMPPGTTAGRLMLDAAKEIRALRTALTPTTDGEREAREALFFADRDHAAGFRCVPEPIHRALSTALNLLATERAKAADAARERAAIVADLRAGAEIVRGLSLDVGPVMADTLIAAALRYESGAHTKETP